MTVDEFEQFVAEVEPVLRRALVGAYGHEIGREACADALAYAWESWPRVRLLKNPAGYLYRVGQSASRKYRRRSALTQGSHTSGDWWVEPALDAAMRALSRRQRAAIVLVDGYGLSLAEAAEILGVRKPSIQNHLRRARSNLRVALRGTE